MDCEKKNRFPAGAVERGVQRGQLPPQFSADDIVKMGEFFPIFHVSIPVAPPDFETFNRPCIMILLFLPCMILL